MKKKTLAQIFFLMIIVFLVVLIYNKYFSENKLNSSIKVVEIKENTKNEKKSNTVYDIKYISYDNNGGKYVIRAARGNITNEDENLTLMEEVSATIELKGLSPINFWSDEAIYNNINYTTEFYKNVLMIYMDHDIKSDNLSLDFDQNLATISNNVFYKNSNSSLKADRIRINLLTKDTKIYMDDKLKKIKIMTKN